MNFEEHYDSIPLEALEHDPFNIRRTYQGIDGLASSIQEHGLQQNLVVRPHPSGEEKWVVTAGNRRLQALNKLAGGWRPDHLSGTPFEYEHVPCLKSNEQTRLWEQTVENVQRQEVPIWDLGARYLELRELGYTQVEIGARIGKTQGHVSRAQRIAEGLHPAIIKELDRLPPGTASAATVARISSLPRDEDGQPVYSAQKKKFDFLVAKGGFKPRGKKAPHTPRKQLIDRFKKLKVAQVPRKHYRTYTVIVAYLGGEINTLDWENPDLEFR